MQQRYVTRKRSRALHVRNGPPKIEDEFHFMFECEKYRVYRNDLIEIFKESNLILSDCNQRHIQRFIFISAVTEKIL